jgi:hypothetical protein
MSGLITATARLRGISICWPVSTGASGCGTDRLIAPGHEPGAHPLGLDARAEQADAGQDEAERKIGPLKAGSWWTGPNAGLARRLRTLPGSGAQEPVEEGIAEHARWVQPVQRRYGGVPARAE